VFGSPLIPLCSHSFLFGHHPLLIESLFGIPLGWVFEPHFQHQPVFSCHLLMILVSNLRMEITNIVLDRVIFVSLPSGILILVIVIVIVNLCQR